MATLLNTVGPVVSVDKDGDVRMLGKCWNPALLERVSGGCDSLCSRSHSTDGNCLVCGETWGGHSGHDCPGGRGRGSWRVGSGGSGRLLVGEAVVVVRGGREGQVGTLIEDDHTSKPFKVRHNDGDTGWYNEGDLRRHNQGSSAAERSGPLAVGERSGPLAVGETVRIRNVSVDEARRLQDGHGESFCIRLAWSVAHSCTAIV